MCGFTHTLHRCHGSLNLTASASGRSGGGIDNAERLPSGHPGAAAAADQRLKAEPPLSAFVGGCSGLPGLLTPPEVPLLPKSRFSRLTGLTWTRSPSLWVAVASLSNASGGMPHGTGRIEALALAACSPPQPLQGRPKALGTLAHARPGAMSQLLVEFPLQPLPSPTPPPLMWSHDTVAVPLPQWSPERCCCRVSSAFAACDSRCRPSDSPLLVGCASRPDGLANPAKRSTCPSCHSGVKAAVVATA